MECCLALHNGHTVKVSEVVPTHAGLGSGTQLTLAVAAGLRRLHNLPLDIEGDALQLGRGARSGIGIGLFSRGGLVVDGGRTDELKPAPIIRHLPLPRHWRVLVILDPQRQGVHGPEEGAAIAALPPMSEADAAQLCRLILMKALPAPVEDDLANFGAAIKELQIRLGDYFAPVQGGTRFMSPDRVAAATSHQPIDTISDCDERKSCASERARHRADLVMAGRVIAISVCIAKSRTKDFKEWPAAGISAAAKSKTSGVTPPGQPRYSGWNLRN